MRKITWLSFLLLALAFVKVQNSAAASAGPLRLASPDGAVRITFSLNAANAPVYSVTFHGQTVVEDSPLSLEFRQGGTWGAGQEITDVRRNMHDET